MTIQNLEGFDTSSRDVFRAVRGGESGLVV